MYFVEIEIEEDLLFFISCNVYKIFLAEKRTSLFYYAYKINVIRIWSGAYIFYAIYLYSTRIVHAMNEQFHFIPEAISPHKMERRKN